jgi:hypothetical protein
MTIVASMKGSLLSASVKDDYSIVASVKGSLLSRV